VIPLLSQPGNRSGKLQLQTVQFAAISSRKAIAKKDDEMRGPDIQNQMSYGTASMVAEHPEMRKQTSHSEN